MTILLGNKDFSNRSFQIREKLLDSELVQSDQFFWEHKDLTYKKCKSFLEKVAYTKKQSKLPLLTVVLIFNVSMSFQKSFKFSS